jgi:hypothetical protein
MTALAEANRCDYCVSFHATALRNAAFDPDRIGLSESCHTVKVGPLLCHPMRTAAASGSKIVGAAPSLTVASWNIQSIRGASTDRLERQAAALARHDPDLVTLQEVGSRYDLPNRLRDCLVQVGFRYFLFSGPQTPTDKAQTDKQYGNVIASRVPLRSRSWPIQTTWPQLIISAEFDWSESPVLIVSAHIPNGRGNGWEKVYALEALAVGLTQITMPTILTAISTNPSEFAPLWCPSVLTITAARPERSLVSVSRTRDGAGRTPSTLSSHRAREKTVAGAVSTSCLRPEQSSRQPTL